MQPWYTTPDLGLQTVQAPFQVLRLRLRSHGIRLRLGQLPQSIHVRLAALLLRRCSQRLARKQV